jgi:hypothetical protein
MTGEVGAVFCPPPGVEAILPLTLSPIVDCAMFQPPRFSLLVAARETAASDFVEKSQRTTMPHVGLAL